MKFIILDLDNCISDDAWRAPKIRWDVENPHLRYQAYHEGCGLDRAQNTHLALGHNIIISTCRPESVKQVTMRWLALHGIKPVAMLMRTTGDHRPAAVIKKEHYHRVVNGLSFQSKDIHCVYDDNPAVIAMYKELGVNAEQIYINDPNQYERHRNANRPGNSK